MSPSRLPAPARQSLAIVALGAWAALAPACSNKGSTGAASSTSAAASAVAAPSAAAVSAPVVAASGPGLPGTSPCATGTPNAEACLKCEANSCAHEPTYRPYCQDLKDPADQAKCQAVLDCVRQTDCIKNGPVACYCGAGEGVPACRANAAQPGLTCPPGEACPPTAGAHGACIKEITAGFPPGSAPSFIVGRLNIVTFPAGAAMAQAQCDYVNCGDITNSHACIPYCR